MTTLTVTIAPDASTVHMVKATWSQTIPAAALPDWIGLYTRLRDREHERYRQFYEDDTRALEAAQREIRRMKA